ncbi:MAG: 16S rRNA (cytidine(1402)-2'-O)-methyltransferase [Myxococcales bacterium]|nr:16S rRNA (cytidine(1402)-2'-O)-methyltransferase [Myxococcales bacterium]MCB9715683.1 16S rRNA (cytidine(1402)-2'-O)-methyltransferase [Myxococcales bacterium]
MLYIVATPIGNLEDVSLRALEVLRTVDVIASEDTRHTAKLLTRHQIKARQMPFHEHNEARVVGKIVRLLEEGRDVALVSDAGTPGIADPGFALVRRCHEEGLDVTMVPGPAAFVMAVVLSGLPVHSFTFRGFPPRKPGKRRRFLAVDARSPHTLVLYESPYRVVALLQDALEVFGDRQAALCNDLTKKFEEVRRGTLSELLESLGDTKIRGEYVVVIQGRDGDASEEDEPETEDEPRRDEVDDEDEPEDDEAFEPAPDDDEPEQDPPERSDPPAPE